MKINKIKNNTKSSGFSLVELLIVIAVIGIMSAVAIPGINQLTEKAKDATARRNAKVASELYTAASAAGLRFDLQRASTATSATTTTVANVTPATAVTAYNRDRTDGKTAPALSARVAGINLGADPKRLALAIIIEMSKGRTVNDATSAFNNTQFKLKGVSPSDLVYASKFLLWNAAERTLDLDPEATGVTMP